MKQLILIAHNIRSTHNVGSLLRTCDGLGADRVYLTGYTPYPFGQPGDTRLPHIVNKLDKQINKTALGAEKAMAWQHADDITQVLEQLKADGFVIAALEQTAGSVPIQAYKRPGKVAIIVGREVEGIEPEVLALCDVTLEIPMRGSKESFNVAIAASMALYQLTL